MKRKSLKSDQEHKEAAFPRSGYDFFGGEYSKPQSGMSKRFYAACQVVKAVIRSPLNDDRITDKKIVERTYKIVDELLKQENT